MLYSVNQIQNFIYNYKTNLIAKSKLFVKCLLTLQCDTDTEIHQLIEL